MSAEQKKHLEVVGGASGEDSAGEMTWPPPSFDKNAKPLHGHLRKKRYHSSSFSHSGANGLTIEGIPSDLHTLTANLRRVQITGNRLPYGKNSKKSRDGRKFPNRRGGKNLDNPTDILDELELDPHDPDYDSDTNAAIVFDEVQPSLTDEEFEKMFSSLLNEFFVHGKTQEVLDALLDIKLSSCQRRRLPYLAVLLAFQHKQTQCELTSELLSDMCGKILNSAHIQQGFQLVFNELGDIIIDVPKAPEYLGRFIARAMADDILPPKFLELQKSALAQLPAACPPKVHGQGDTNLESTNLTQISGIHNDHATTRSGRRNPSDSSNENVTPTSSGIGSASSLTMTRPDIALQAISRAESLLTLRHAFARLDTIWGVPVGPKAAKLLSKKIQRLLCQFIESKDIAEATEALLELDCPHFHHELVFQAIIMAIEESKESVRDLVINLLDDLSQSVILTSYQLTLGIHRVYAELPDLQLDVPLAYTQMERILIAANKAGFLPKKLLDDFPAKHRKRFISETDSIYRTTTQSTYRFCDQ